MMRMKKLCRGATRGRPCDVTIDIVASELRERAGTGPAPTGTRVGGIFIGGIKTPRVPLSYRNRQRGHYTKTARSAAADSPAHSFRHGRFHDHNPGDEGS